MNSKAELYILYFLVTVAQMVIFTELYGDVIVKWQMANSVIYSFTLAQMTVSGAVPWSGMINLVEFFLIVLLASLSGTFLLSHLFRSLDSVFMAFRRKNKSSPNGV